MSAPAWATFFKENQAEMIQNCFINTGWVFDEAKFLRQISEYLQENEFDYDYFVAYGEKYYLQRDELQVRIAELQVEQRRAFKTRMETK